MPAQALSCTRRSSARRTACLASPASASSPTRPASRRDRPGSPASSTAPSACASAPMGWFSRALVTPLLACGSWQVQANKLHGPQLCRRQYVSKADSCRLHVRIGLAVEPAAVPLVHVRKWSQDSGCSAVWILLSRQPLCILEASRWAPENVR